MNLNWLRKLLEVPIPEAPPCETCEAYKNEIEHLRFQNKRFMDNLLIKPEPEPVREPVPVTLPKTIPWAVKRQQLEQKDREKAAEIRAQRNAAKPDNMMETSDLEKEMDLVAKERENAGK